MFRARRGRVGAGRRLMKTGGVIASWLRALEPDATNRVQAMRVALDRTLSGRSPELLATYRAEFASRLPDSPLRAQLLLTIDAKLR